MAVMEVRDLLARAPRLRVFWTAFDYGVSFRSKPATRVCFFERLALRTEVSSKSSYLPSRGHGSLGVPKDLSPPQIT
jgi:hypothetical protein